MRYLVSTIAGILLSIYSCAQTSTVRGTVLAQSEGLPLATVQLKPIGRALVADNNGEFIFESIPYGDYTIQVSYTGFEPVRQSVQVRDSLVNLGSITLLHATLSEVVVSGTMKEMDKLDSPVPVEVYQPVYFKRNPTPNMFEAMQNVNGVRPQLNCSVCNTGDIHINGLEGPYTMVLVDGMPIVSGLATVYGLSGIPNSVIERVEIVKGPASALYGSEAVGGLINVITKNPVAVPLVNIDLMATSWQEYNADLSVKLKAGNRATVLTGANYYNYKNPIDKNADNFTDVTLQDRISVFQKWQFERNNNRQFSVAGRYLYEDRWGGEMQWKPEFRGGDSIYAESIYTNRAELIAAYQLPLKERIVLRGSFNTHSQNSAYGNTPYFADQRIGFAQATWDNKIGRHDLLAGTAFRYTFYDDNTPATANGLINEAIETHLPGVFVQNEIDISEFWSTLLGFRYDYNSNHGNIYTPRFALKWQPDLKTTLRFNAGTGYRVVNLFAEEHSALTGARDVVVIENLDPEQSFNANFNATRNIYPNDYTIIGLDASAWYTHFTNQILPDYDTNPNQIIYDNLNGHSVSRGVAINMDFDLRSRWQGNIGASYIDVFFSETDEAGRETTTRPVLTETWTGVWSLSYFLERVRTKIDYTGNIYGPMRLPTLGPEDPRPLHSPWWSIQNVQATYISQNERFEIYSGIKNLLNYTPPANSIARPFDPFDKQVEFDADGQVVANANNPYALTFDPTYVYAPNQGVRFFIGFRMALN